MRYGKPEKIPCRRGSWPRRDRWISGKGSLLLTLSEFLVVPVDRPAKELVLDDMDRMRHLMIIHRIQLAQFKELARGRDGAASSGRPGSCPRPHPPCWGSVRVRSTAPNRAWIPWGTLLRRVVTLKMHLHWLAGAVLNNEIGRPRRR